MRYWFSGDYHLSHSNIVQYAGRPFSDVKEMNTAIIERHNERVDPEDTVFFLGDFRFGNQPTEDELNGKFVFVRGNHDGKSGRRAIIHRMVLDHGGQRLLLVHDPKHIEPKDAEYYDLALTAHVHNNWKVSGDYPIPAVNVGVDVWNFKPQQINDILGRLYRQQNKG